MKSNIHKQKNQIKLNVSKNSTLFSSLFVLLGNIVFGQVAIGKQSINGNSTILDFADTTATESPTDKETTNYKGIILSAVESSPTFTVVTPTTNNPNNGTFLFDKASKKIRMFENGTWVDLSNAGNSSNVIVNSSAETGKGVIIGSETTNAQGVLVLESSDKAVIIPHIKNPHTTVKGPYPGMMCYDTVSNTIAVFDGSNWNYWR